MKNVSKLVIVLGLCLVLGGALSGCVDATQDQNETDTTNNNGGATTNGGNGGGNSGGGDGNGGGENTGAGSDEVVTEADVENMTVECEVEEAVVSDGDVDVPEEFNTRAGPEFNVTKAETMLHRELNDLRTTHGNDSVGPLLCDPYLREIAQEHSRVMAEKGFLGSEVPDENVNLTENPEYGNLSVRYEGICEDPKEQYGRWLYQRNQVSNWEGPSLSQRRDIANDHEQLIRDMRGAWFNDDVSMDVLTQENVTRQGIGIHINRSSRLVHVTQAVC